MPTKLIERLQSKDYRDAFVGSLVNMRIPVQIRALREHRGWTQQELAEKSQMLQPRISAMERPGGSKLNLETLRRVASAFDCGILVRFVPFSELTRWFEEFDPESFNVSDFEHDHFSEQGIAHESILSANSYGHAQQPANGKNYGDLYKSFAADIALLREEAANLFSAISNTKITFNNPEHAGIGKKVVSIEDSRAFQNSPRTNRPSKHRYSRSRRSA